MGRKKTAKTPAAVKLGGAIRAARDRAGKSQERVAQHFGLTRQAIGAWESGESSPSGVQLRELAVFLNNATILGVNEEISNYAVGSSPELRGLHSVPLKGQLSPVYGGIWMNTSMPDMLVGVRVLWNETAPELYAYKIAGDELEPRYHAGEFLIMDPRAPVEADEEVLVEHVDGRRAVLVFVARGDGRVKFHRIGFEPRPMTLEESEISAMHIVTGHQKRAHWMDVAGRI